MRISYRRVALPNPMDFHLSKYVQRQAFSHTHHPTTHQPHPPKNRAHTHHARAVTFPGKHTHTRISTNISPSGAEAATPAACTNHYCRRLGARCIRRPPHRGACAAAMVLGAYIYLYKFHATTTVLLTFISSGAPISPLPTASKGAQRSGAGFCVGVKGRINANYGGNRCSRAAPP